MPEHDFRGLASQPVCTTLPAAVLNVITAFPGWPLLPAELAALIGPGWALEAAYREGLTIERLRAAALQLVSAADACPQPWPGRAQRLQKAINTLGRAAASPFGPQLTNSEPRDPTGPDSSIAAGLESMKAASR